MHIAHVSGWRKALAKFRLANVTPLSVGMSSPAAASPKTTGKVLGLLVAATSSVRIPDQRQRQHGDYGINRMVPNFRSTTRCCY